MTISAAEMVALEQESGELQTHQAGVFDLGSGHDAPGTWAVTEVRSHDVAPLPQHAQPVYRLGYERLPRDREPPRHPSQVQLRGADQRVQPPLQQTRGGQILRKRKPDPQAVSVTRQVHQLAHPLATILFGSRARGNHREDSSDIDILLVGEAPGTLQQESRMQREAQEISDAIYGRTVPTQVLWITREKFKQEEMFLNSVSTRAMLEGVVFSDHPEDFRSRYDGEDPPPPRYEWDTYQINLREAGRELTLIWACLELSQGREPSRKLPATFRSLMLVPMDKEELEDNVRVRPASALEYALKAAVAATGEVARGRAGIPELDRMLRQVAPLADSRTEIPLEACLERELPRGMNHQAFVEAVDRDVNKLRRLAMRLKRRTEKANDPG